MVPRATRGKATREFPLGPLRGHNAWVDLRYPAALLLGLPLLLLIVVAARRSAAGLSRRRFRLGLALRLSLGLLLVLVAAEVRTVLPHDGRSVVFVIDASASVGAAGRRQAHDWTTRSWAEHRAEDLAGVVLVGGAGGEVSFCEDSHVRFRGDLEDAELDAYVALGEARGCAGGYMAEGRGAWLIEGIEGDWNNVIGLPVFRLITELRCRGARLGGGP